MDWITGIQRVIDYVEAHLDEPIDYAQAAKQAASSPFHFQRVFSTLCGFTLGDYIRMRRLSLAAEELSKTDARVLDIALKYGYDSPESFSRAFTRFHGIRPSQARAGGRVRSFSRLSVKLILSGGNVMEYRIEKKEAFTLVCARRHVNKPQGDTATADISAFWRQCGADGLFDRLEKYSRFDHFGGVLGVCFSSEMDEAGFPYGIGAEYNGLPLAGEDLELVEIPAATYAVFPCRGPMPDAFRSTYLQICSEFFPQSRYEYGNGTELEVYPSANTDDPNYYCEIWIAVREK